MIRVKSKDGIPYEVVIEAKTFQSEIPVSKEMGPELEHMGLIVYDHDRENCAGCKVNRALAKMREEALLAISARIELEMMGARRKEEP
ncbi:MAG: hypothetical protein GY769_07770 [bacterium]|nr:hypothetical protein [bacterium]